MTTRYILIESNTGCVTGDITTNLGESLYGTALECAAVLGLSGNYGFVPSAPVASIGLHVWQVTEPMDEYVPKQNIGEPPGEGVSNYCTYLGFLKEYDAYKEPTELAVLRAWQLGHAYGHHWAGLVWDDRMAYAQILVDNGLGDHCNQDLWDNQKAIEAREAYPASSLSERPEDARPPKTVQECRLLSALPCGPCGGIGYHLDPDGSYGHVTATGRTSWTIDPEGEVSFAINRPTGEAIYGWMTVTDHVEIRIIGDLEIRHVVAARTFLAALGVTLRPSMITMHTDPQRARTLAEIAANWETTTDPIMSASLGECFCQQARQHLAEMIEVAQSYSVGDTVRQSSAHDRFGIIVDLGDTPGVVTVQWASNSAEPVAATDLYHATLVELPL